MEPTDFKNVIVENIPPAPSLACLLKFYRKQMQRKFYYEETQRLDDFEILASVTSKKTSKRQQPWRLPSGFYFK